METYNMTENWEVPEEKKEEFSLRLLALLGESGMMSLKTECLDGETVSLLSPSDDGGTDWIYLNYNYYEDQGWDTVRVRTDGGSLRFGRTGICEFRLAVTALRVLEAIYAEGAHELPPDGDIDAMNAAVGWINCLFREEYPEAVWKHGSPPEHGSVAPATGSPSGDIVDGGPAEPKNTEEYLDRVNERLFSLGFDNYRKKWAQKALRDGLVSRKPYRITSADRLYFWTEGGDVCIHRDTDAWLKRLVRRHREIMERAGTEGADAEPLTAERLARILTGINDRYCRLYAFREMFSDFTEHGDDPARRAAAVLLEQLAEENTEYGDLVRKVKGCWGIRWRNVTMCEGRLRIKRCLAVMANREIREKYFGF